ncbi:MAG TPA: hypothetical protein VGM24_02920 [Puia sp.]|jgi:hypothetical protein
MYQLSKTEFLQQYGRNDSSRALIRFYFAKRYRARNLILLSGAIGIVSGAFIGALALSAGTDSYLWGIFLASLTTLVAEAVITLTLIGGTRLMVMSRKKLLLRLRQYEEEGYIPKNIRNSKFFQSALKGEPDLHRRPARNTEPHKKLNYYLDNP